mgnify:CR=1 FL=1
MIGMMSGDLTEFQRWATGNLVENRNRGIFGEWLVGQALGVIGDDEVRQEWDAVDLHFDGLTIEVKTSGVRDSVNQVQDQTWRISKRLLRRKVIPG